MPSPHAAASIALTLAMFILFARGRIRVEVVCLITIGLLALGFYFFPVQEGTEKKGIEIAFGGFGHPALVTICCLMIIGRGLVATGALEPVTAILSRIWQRNTGLGLLSTLLACGGLSMFINDTPVMVLALPILLTLAAKTGVPPSQTLMPVNFAVLLGGMTTTIGTSTNLLVVSIAERSLNMQIGVFDFTLLALIAIAIAIPYLWLVMPRLLPSNRPTLTGSPRRFFATLHIEDTAAVIDCSLPALREKIGDAVEVGGVRRGAYQFRSNDLAVHLRPGDIVMIEGPVSELRAASDVTKSSLMHPGAAAVLRAPKGEMMMAEVVIGVDSPLVGATVRSAQIADRYGAIVIGLYRPDRTLFHEQLEMLGERLEVGDVLLIQGEREKLDRLQGAEGAMVLEGAAELPQSAHAPAALLIAAAVVVAAALRVVPISIAALAGTIAMFLTGCVKFERLGGALSGEVIVLVAASIAMGDALVTTGAADWMGQGLSFLLGPLPAPAALVVVMSFAALVTNFSSNTAAAAITTPIAIAVATKLGIPPQAMVLAVLFGSNLAFATPMAYQTNILIMSAGGYRFGDYVRAGLPLVILMVITLSTLLVIWYGVGTSPPPVLAAPIVAAPGIPALPLQ